MSAIDRSLALGVCESVQSMAVPSPRKRKSRADRWLTSTTVATQVPNVTVRLSHTSVSTLSSTFASNVTGPVTTV